MVANTCSFCKKNTYQIRDDAEKTAEEQESLSLYKVEIKVYRCPYGSGWHLSSSKESSDN